MSNKKVRVGYCGFLTKVIKEVDKHLQDEYATTRKVELLKWKAGLKEQPKKILSLNEQILAKLVAEEKVMGEEEAEEIEKSEQLKADATQVLVATEERLTYM